MLWVLHKFKCTMKNSWICLALLVAQFAFGQSTKETNAWLKLGHKSSLSEAWSLSTSGQYRSGFGMSNDQWLTELDFKKSVNKKWDIGTELRHYVVFDRKGGIQGNFQRARVQFSAEQHINLPVGKAHIRYAVQQRQVLTGSGNNKFTARIRGEFDLPIKNFSWDPTFGVEYLASGDPDFDRSLRLGVSTGDKIAGKKLSFGYFFQRDLTNAGFHAHVLQSGIRF